MVCGKDLEALEPSEMMIRVTNGAEVHCGNSYDIELLLLTLGCVFRWIAAVFTTPGVSIDLFSDCKSAVDIANQTDLTHIRHYGHKAHGILLRQIFRSKYRSDISICHVYGHPERRLGKEDSYLHLKGEEAGIYLADMAAGPRYSSVECKRPLIETTAKEVLQTMRCLEECVVVDKEDTPILEDPLSLIQQHQFMKYLEDRDKGKNVLRWTTYLRTAPHVITGGLNRFAVRARRTKLIFNWYLREEQGLQHDVPILCPLCQEDMHTDSEKHLYTNCKYIEIENIRLETLESLRMLVYNDPSAPLIVLQVLAKLYVILTTTNDRHLLWKGMIPRDYWNDLANTLPHPTQLPLLTKRRIIDDIRQAFRLMGSMVHRMRKISTMCKHRLVIPPPVVGELTPTQSRCLRLKSQTRLPRLWGIIIPEGQIDWEIRRRLRSKKMVTSPIQERRQNPMTHYFPTISRNREGGSHSAQRPTLIPACLVIRRLRQRDKKQNREEDIANKDIDTEVPH